MSVRVSVVPVIPFWRRQIRSIGAASLCRSNEQTGRRNDSPLSLSLLGSFRHSLRLDNVIAPVLLSLSLSFRCLSSFPVITTPQRGNQMTLGGYTAASSPSLHPRLPFHTHLTKREGNDFSFLAFCYFRVR